MESAYAAGATMIDAIAAATTTLSTGRRFITALLAIGRVNPRASAPFLIDAIECARLDPTGVRVGTTGARYRAIVARLSRRNQKAKRRICFERCIPLTPLWCCPLSGLPSRPFACFSVVIVL